MRMGSSENEIAAYELVRIRKVEEYVLSFEMEKGIMGNELVIMSIFF